ncbi:hypothetical protein [Adhaeribacter aquaticus]|uniref:hypothetical protein n=1 Tax=Adhaeribacter aquaticus TaxID=299567 RepID=UPI0003F76DC1|nr:hypothetical protein [Adhaeribacter aquaticus]
MLNLTLTDTNGNQYPVQVPTNWQEVTVLQFAQLQGKSQLEQAAILLGLPLEQIHQLEIRHLDILLNAMVFLLTPIPEQESNFPKNIGMESIGQMELCKKFIALHEEGTMWDIAPYVYAIYCFADRYNMEAAFGIDGFPPELVIEAQQLPIPQVYSAIVFFFGALERIQVAYAPILQREYEGDEVAAGVDRFEKYGFLFSIYVKAQGSPARFKELLQVPANTYYINACMETEQDDYLKALHEIKNPKTA